MTENLMNSDHKATNEKFREGHAKIRWKKPVKKEKEVTKLSDANEFFNKFVKI